MTNKEKLLIIGISAMCLSAIAGFISNRIAAEQSSGAVSIIGGSDGPTSIFLAGKLGGDKEEADTSAENESEVLDEEDRDAAAQTAGDQGSSEQTSEDQGVSEQTSDAQGASAQTSDDQKESTLISEENVIAESGVTIRDLKYEETYMLPLGIYMEVTDVSGSRVTVEIKNMSGYTMYYGNDIQLLRQEDDQWVEVSPIEEFDWEDIAYEIKDLTSHTVVCDLSAYGKLPRGRYRLIKSELSADFEIGLFGGKGLKDRG